jgi:hypothetical protein
MSTKTSIKRIALVAVSALGLGMVTVNHAAAAEAAAVTDLEAIALNGVYANYQVVQREDVAFSVTTGIDVNAGLGATEEITLKAVFTSKPAASTLTYVDATTGVANDTTDNDGAGTATDGDGSTASKIVVDGSGAGETLLDDTNVGSWGFTPDVPGTYVVRTWHDQDLDGFYDAGTEETATITVIAGGTPSTLTMTTYGATSVAAGDNLDAREDGALIKLLLKDSAGNATKLAAGEGLTVTGTGSVSLNGTADSITLTSASTFDISGEIIVNVTKAAAGSSTVTVSAAGTIASAFASQTSALTFKTAVEYGANTAVIDETTGVSATAAGTGAAAAAINASTSKTSIAYEVTSAAAGTTRYVAVNVVDTTGSITGYAGATYTEAIAISDTAAGTASFSITPATWSATLRAATGVAAADAYTVVIADSADADAAGWTVTAAASSNSASESSWNISSVSAVAGGSVSATLTVEDQYGLVRAGQPVTFSIAGRNAAITTGLSAVTDANGKATFTYTDTGTATSATTDTISASANGTSVTATVSVSFDAANTVSTVTVTSGDTTAGVDNLTSAPTDIAAGTAGASATTQAVTATIKNAAGTTLAGVAVTFSISGEGAAVTSTTKTVYTNASGVATANIYAWKTGSYTVTATAGGKSGSGKHAFYQSTASEARSVSATAVNGRVVATVKDRFGNPVSGATVYAIVTDGSGYFGSNGSVSTSATSNKSGEATFVVTGAATVKVTTTDPAGNGLAPDQTTAPAGKVSGSVATPVAFTATTTGTTSTAETGVGASFADAGVNSVSVEVANTTSSDSVDAANEATDAANAATDAANAAAEAADAATAAAQDAQAAVTELATQVAALIAGIKAQITTLTNLVIKIQKKVKA